MTTTTAPAAARGQKTGPPGPWPDGTSADLRLVTGLAAAGFSALYVVADLIEVAQGGFSTFRMVLTYLAEAAIPLFVLGLYAVQRPAIGRLGLAGAVAYAYSYVFFTATVVYALAAGTPNYQELGKVFGAWMTVHGLIMVAGGLALGLATVRAGVFPRWTGLCLMAGVVLVAAASWLPSLGPRRRRSSPRRRIHRHGPGPAHQPPAADPATLAALVPGDVPGSGHRRAGCRQAHRSPGPPRTGRGSTPAIPRRSRRG